MNTRNPFMLAGWAVAFVCGVFYGDGYSMSLIGGTAFAFFLYLMWHDE